MYFDLRTVLEHAAVPLMIGLACGSLALLVFLGRLLWGRGRGKASR